MVSRPSACAPGRPAGGSDRAYVLKVARRRRYAARRAALDELYQRPVSFEVCAYCGGVAGSVDHVPPLLVAAGMSAVELAASCFRLVPACLDCNRSLARCSSSDLGERRAFALDVRSGARAKLRRSERMAGYRVLVSRGAFQVRLTGWRNAYVAFLRDAGGAWEQVCSASSLGELLRQLALVPMVSDELLAACKAVLPELPASVPPGSGPLLGRPGRSRFGVVLPGELLRVVIPPEGRTFRVQARQSVGAHWRRLFGAGNRSRLLVKARASCLPPEFVEACEGLPELPSEWPC